MNEQSFLNKIGITSVISMFTTCFGWFGWLVVLYFSAMLLDYITGTAYAIKEHKWSSKRAAEGIWKKVGSILAVAAAALADCTVMLLIQLLPEAALPFQAMFLFCPLVMGWYIITELGSVIENANQMGAPIPAFLRNVFSKLRKSVERAAQTNTDDHSDQ